MLIAVATLTPENVVVVQSSSWFDHLVPFKELRQVATDSCSYAVATISDSLSNEVFVRPVCDLDAFENVVGWTPRDVLRQAIDEICYHGYVSRKDSDLSNCDPTADRVQHTMQSRLPPVPHDANDESHIDDILDWLNGKSVANDYFNAVREVLSSDIVSPRDVGLVTSAVGVYLRDQQEQDHPEVEGAWIGSTGDLVETKLVVTGERAVQTIFGPRHLTKLRTSDGDRVKWWGNGPTGLSQGDVVLAKGMVGECQVWANRRETTLKYAEWQVIEHATSPTIQDHDDSLF